MACKTEVKKIPEKRGSSPKIPSAPPQDLVEDVPNASPPSYDELFHQPTPSPRTRRIQNSSLKYSTFDKENIRAWNRVPDIQRPSSCFARLFPAPLHCRNQIEANILSTFSSPSDEDFYKAISDLHPNYQNRLKKNKRMRIVNHQTYCVWKYEIKSIVESRHRRHKEKPFCGSVDAKECEKKGFSLWDLTIDGNMSDFKTQHLKLPGSSSIVQCDKCGGRGMSPCSTCYGKGSVSCQGCFGSENQIINYSNHRISQTVENCSDCQGKGTTRCTSCHGYTTVPCQSCNETGKKETFIEVAVVREEKNNHYYTDDCFRFCREFLGKCKGIKVYEDVSTEGNIGPITQKECSHCDILKRSLTYVKEHKCVGKSSRVIHQKQSISMIPVHEVTYENQNEKLKTFFLVGTNYHVYSLSSSSKSFCCFM